MSSTSSSGQIAEARDQIMSSSRRYYSQTTSYYFYKKLLFLLCTFVSLSLLDTTHATLSQCKITGTSGFCSGMEGKFIRVDSNPHIRVLYIVSSDLSSLTAEDFSPFQNLITLHINNCSISRATNGSLLSGLKTLTTLQITYSQLSDDIWSMFEKNTALNSLTLQWNNITRISKDTFSHLKDITTIDVGNNNISEVETGAFENMTSLLKLNLAHNNIGYSEYSELTLSSDNCRGCGDECSAACRSTESTKYLWQQFQNHSDILFLKDNPVCSKIKSTQINDKANEPTSGESQTKEQFFLHACSNVDEREREREGERQRERKSKYEETPLPECSFTGTSGYCSQMTGKFICGDFNPNILALYIVNSDLTYLSGDDFSPFQNLITLHINNCTISRRSKENLLSDLKTLTELQITHSDLSDDIWSMFGGNTALKKLTLQWNKLTRIAKETFSHLKEIESIDVSHNNISEIEKGAFENTPSLQTLNVTHNKIGQHFDPTLASADCSGCEEECPPACRSNENADYLWQQFQKHYDIVLLKDNPVCSKIEDEEPQKASHELTQSDERKKFLETVCSQGFEAVKRHKKSDGHDQDLDSGDVEDGHGDSDDSKLELVPEVDGEVSPSAELDGNDSTLHADSEDAESRAVLPDGGNSNDAALPLSSVEVDGRPVPETAVMSSHLLLAAAIAVPGLITVIIIGARTLKRPEYKEVGKCMETDGIELQVWREQPGTQPVTAHEEVCSLLTTVVTHDTPKEQRIVDVPLDSVSAEK